MTTFIEMGFTSSVTEASATPTKDGYIGDRDGIPWNIHPTATPKEWAALEIAIKAGSVTVAPFVAPTLTLTDAKSAKIKEISGAFVNAIMTGHCTLSLGWDIDCRRGVGTDDEANMRGLLEIAKKNGLADTAQIDTNGIKGYDNQWHPATVADVRDTIIPEMCEYGASLYKKKFQLQAQVEAITLASGSDGSVEVAKVKAITWS